MPLPILYQHKTFQVPNPAEFARPDAEFSFNPSSAKSQEKTLTPTLRPLSFLLGLLIFCNGVHSAPTTTSFLGKPFAQVAGNSSAYTGGRAQFGATCIGECIPGPSTEWKKRVSANGVTLVDKRIAENIYPPELRVNETGSISASFDTFLGVTAILPAPHPQQKPEFYAVEFGPFTAQAAAFANRDTRILKLGAEGTTTLLRTEISEGMVGVYANSFASIVRTYAKET